MPALTLGLLLSIIKAAKKATICSAESPSSDELLYRGQSVPNRLYIDFELEKPKDKKRKIGTGAIGDIKVRQRKGDPNFVVAVKTMRYSEDETRNKEMDRALEKEITPLMFCQHPNILEYLGLTRAKSRMELGIVCRYAENQSLGTYLKKNPNSANRINILRDVAAGLEYLHAPVPDIVFKGEKLTIVHGDVHPGNVLIMGDGRAVLADFGLCKVAEAAARTSLTVRIRNEAGGVAVYIGPEVHRPESLQFPGLQIRPAVRQQPEYVGRRTAKADVFAFGMLVFAAFADKDPEESIGSETVMTTIAIIQGERPKRKDITRSDFSDALWTLACECWQADAAKRPLMADVRRRVELIPSRSHLGAFDDRANGQ